MKNDLIITPGWFFFSLFVLIMLYIIFSINRWSDEWEEDFRNRFK